MKPTRLFAPLAAAGVLLASMAARAEPVAVEPSIKGYSPAGEVSGNLTAIGSDTLNNLMTLWSEAFKKQHPKVKIQVEGKGSTTAPPALIAGTAQLGPMSRLMKPEEIDGFEKQYGYKPTAVRVAVDGLAVFVNKDNPLAQLTMPQVDAIFSKTRKGGTPDDIMTWGQLGLTGDWAPKPISLYGRNSASGTYGYFKEHAPYKGTQRHRQGTARQRCGRPERHLGQIRHRLQRDRL
jgi:phosphate transport system substrate-binding protein